MISHVGKMPPVGSYFTHNKNCHVVWVMINNDDVSNCRRLYSNGLGDAFHDCSYECEIWVLTQEEVDNLKIKLL